MSKQNTPNLKNEIYEDIAKTAEFCQFQINKHKQRGLELCKIRCMKRLQHYEKKVGLSCYRRHALELCKLYLRADEVELVKIIIAFVLVA